MSGLRRGIPRRTALPVAVCLLAAGLGVSTGAAASRTGCAGPAGGGDWPSYGGDLRNTRSQPRERTIDAANAGDLEPAWAFMADGALHTTPITGGGCVYAADDNTVYAVNADTGQLVWKHRFDASGLYSVAYSQGKVFANVNLQGEEGPSGAALDARTGRVLYVSEPIEFGSPASAIASAVAWDRYQLVATTGGDGSTSARPGVGLLDNRTGKLLVKRPFATDAAAKPGSTVELGVCRVP